MRSRASSPTTPWGSDLHDFALVSEFDDSVEVRDVVISLLLLELILEFRKTNYPPVAPVERIGTQLHRLQGRFHGRTAGVVLYTDTSAVHHGLDRGLPG